MALSSNTAGTLAAQQGPSGSLFDQSRGAGGSLFASTGPGFASNTQPAQYTGPPMAPNPAADAQTLANSQLQQFNMNQALQSITNAPQVAAMRRQSDYYGLLAGAAKNMPGSGQGARAAQNAAVEQAILGLHQMQLGNDAKTLQAQHDYAQNLFGNATKQYDQGRGYLTRMQQLAQKTYAANIPTFAKALAASKANTATQMGNYTEDAAARGAYGAAGTTQNLGNLQKAGAKTNTEINANRKSFVTDFKKQLATFANQKFQNRSEYEKAFASLIDKNSEIANALANNTLAGQMDEKRKQQASIQASMASSGAAQQAWQNSMAALSYQAQQAGVDSSIAGMGPQGINWSGLNLQDPNVFAFMNAATGGGLAKWLGALPGAQSQNDLAGMAMRRGSGNF